MPASRKPACAGHEMTRKEALFLAHIRRRLSDCGQTDAFDFCEARAKYRVSEVSREAEPAWAFSCAALGGFRVTGLAENRRLEWRATFDEGRRKTECQMMASKYPIRPSRQNGDTPFQRQSRSASRRGSWFAPVGAASAANTHIRQYMRNAQKPSICWFLA